MIGEARNVYHLGKVSRSEQSFAERPCGLQSLAMPWELAHTTPLKFITYHRLPWVLDYEI